MSIRVIGAGLAGCEAAWQIANRGIKVDLFEMKPLRFSPAHKNPGFCRTCLLQFSESRAGGKCGGFA